jgi:hypothetical protein
MRMKITAAGCIVGGVLMACSSTSGGGGSSLTGTVAGTTFSPESSIANVAPDVSTSCTETGTMKPACTSTTMGQVAEVILANRPNLTCAVQQANQSSNVEYANLDSLLLGVFVPGTDVSIVPPGTYDVLDTKSPSGMKGSAATLNTTDAKCNHALNVTATSGTVTLTAVSHQQITGTYNLTFGSQGTFTGSFDSPVCAMVDAGTPGTVTKPVCTQ